MKSVYCAARTGSLNRAVCASSLKGLMEVIYLKGNGKAVPLNAWSGPEGSRKLRFPDFLTTAQDDGKVFSLTHRAPQLDM